MTDSALFVHAYDDPKQRSDQLFDGFFVWRVCLHKLLQGDTFSALHDCVASAKARIRVKIDSTYDACSIFESLK
jgi:hypothetical protein